eukprot:COSAG06_NODE_14382_length_1161_cov_1.625235_2_plen_41_part_01
MDGLGWMDGWMDGWYVYINIIDALDTIWVIIFMIHIGFIII